MMILQALKQAQGRKMGWIWIGNLLIETRLNLFYNLYKNDIYRFCYERLYGQTV